MSLIAFILSLYGSGSGESGVPSNAVMFNGQPVMFNGQYVINTLL